MATPVTLNKKLNLVIPLDTDKGKIWIHSTPISKEIFESNYLLLTKTLANLYSNNIGPSFGPRIALLSLKDTAKEMDETNDLSSGLLQEINRITNVLMPDQTGRWQVIPFVEVINKKLIDEQQISEVENAIVYFIVASAVHLKSELQMAYLGLKNSWSAQTTLLNVTEYGNSLTTSTTGVNTGEKEQAAHQVPKPSSVPS
jgi:hypothetical protein